MTEHYNPINEQKLFNAQERADPIFKTFDPRGAPAPLNGENENQYRKRLADRLKERASDYKDVNVFEANGSAFTHIENGIYDSAAREARHPTQVPDGQLKEVTRYDHTGRKMFEYYGSPSAWLGQFATDKKRLRGIRTATDHSYSPPNVRSVAGLKY